MPPYPTGQGMNLDPGEVSTIRPWVEEGGHDLFNWNCIECQMPDDYDVVMAYSESAGVPLKDSSEAVYRDHMEV
ncbi:MAG: hypothetical protein OSB36_02535 [Longimicrobiales bacterium]|nr:hypothetical protein [Longimicrobiales bacterium]